MKCWAPVLIAGLFACADIALAQSCSSTIQLQTATNILAVMKSLDDRVKKMDKVVKANAVAATKNTAEIAENDSGMKAMQVKLEADFKNALCGNGRIEGSEECDDGNSLTGDGCVDCAVTTGWTCEPSDSVEADTTPSSTSKCHTTSCAKLQCGKNAYCFGDESQPDKFSCKCLGGYSGNPASGCADIDECKANSNTCAHNVPGEVCVNLPGSFKCGHNYIGNGWLQPNSKQSAQTTACTGGGDCDGGHGIDNEQGSYGRWRIKPKPSNIPDVPGGLRPSDGYMIELDNGQKSAKEYEVHQRSGSLFTVSSGATYQYCAWVYNVDSDRRNGIMHSRLYASRGAAFGSKGLGRLPPNKKWEKQCSTYKIGATTSRNIKFFNWYIGYHSKYGCISGKRSCKVYVTGVEWIGPAQPPQIEYIENGWLSLAHRDGNNYRGRTRACSDPLREPYNCDNQHGITNEAGSYGRWRVQPLPSYLPKPPSKDYPSDGQVIKLYADGAYKEYEVHAKPGVRWADPANKVHFSDGVVYTMSAWVYNKGIKVTGNCGIKHIAFNRKGRRVGSYGVGTLPADGAGWVKQTWTTTITSNRYTNGGIDSLNWYIGYPFNGCRCLDGTKCDKDNLEACKCFAAVTGVSVQGPPKY